MSDVIDPGAGELAKAPIVITPEFAELVYEEARLSIREDIVAFRVKEEDEMRQFNPHLLEFSLLLHGKKKRTVDEVAADQQQCGALLAHHIIRRAADLQGQPMPLAPADKMYIFRDADRAHSYGVQPPKPDFVMPKNAGLQAAYERLTNENSRNGFIILASFFETFLKTDNNHL